MSKRASPAAKRCPPSHDCGNDMVSKRSISCFRLEARYLAKACRTSGAHWSCSTTASSLTRGMKTWPHRLLTSCALLAGSAFAHVAIIYGKRDNSQACPVLFPNVVYTVACVPILNFKHFPQLTALVEMQQLCCVKTAACILHMCRGNTCAVCVSCLSHTRVESLLCRAWHAYVDIGLNFNELQRHYDLPGLKRGDSLKGQQC